MPEFRQLNKKLASLYPTSVKAQRLLTYADIPTATIDFTGSAIDMWYSILMEVKKHGPKMQDLLQEAHEEYPQDELLLQFIKQETTVRVKERPDAGQTLSVAYDFSIDDLKTLVAKGKIKETLGKLDLIADDLSNDYQNNIIQTRARLSALERDNAQGILSRQDYNIELAQLRGAVTYLIDQIESEQEIQNILKNIGPSLSIKEAPTRLSVDKASLEKIMGGRDDMQEIEWLTKAINASKSVCKIELTTGEAGTGWILYDRYLMTNNHVIGSKEDANKARAVFNFEKGNEEGETMIFFSPKDGFYTDPGLDYTLLAVKDADKLKDFGSLQVETFNEPAKDQLVNIIQHPHGKSKKLAMPDEVISVWPEKNYLFYLADTEPGSSGSPVFNQDWKVVALHHAGRDKDGGGMVINAAGDKQEANRGILIKAILSDLEKKNFRPGD